MNAHELQAPSPPASAEPTRRVTLEEIVDTSLAYFNRRCAEKGICTHCLGTGWAFVPHSDESRERCACRTAGHPNLPPFPTTISYDV